MAFGIKVNGNTHDVDVDGDTPLLWVLRDVLGMTGTKFGCGMALCGACTVHIDGAPTRSCITSIDSVGASSITTIQAVGATAAPLLETCVFLACLGRQMLFDELAHVGECLERHNAGDDERSRQ